MALRVPDPDLGTLTINKIRKEDYIANYDVISTQLSDEFFLTVNDPGEGYIVYLEQAEYDRRKLADSLMTGVYYATPDPAGSNPT